MSFIITRTWRVCKQGLDGRTSVDWSRAGVPAALPDPEDFYVPPVPDVFTLEPKLFRRFLGYLTRNRRHRFYLSTGSVKRAEKVLKTCQSADGEDALWPLRNVWLGVSVAGQQDIDVLVPRLVEVETAHRFVYLHTASEIHIVKVPGVDTILVGPDFPEGWVQSISIGDVEVVRLVV